MERKRFTMCVVAVISAMAFSLVLMKLIESLNTASSTAETATLKGNL